MNNDCTYIVYRHDDDIVALLLSESQDAMSNPRGSEKSLSYDVIVPANLKDYKIIVAPSKFEALRKYFFQQEGPTMVYPPGVR